VPVRRSRAFHLSYAPYFTPDPIAMSVRSTNVYEEQSLGIFHEESNEEHAVDPESAPRLSVLSQYVVTHVQKQLAFGASFETLVYRY
jgi:hypothetical protein